MIYFKHLSFYRIKVYLARIKELQQKSSERGKDFWKKDGELFELALTILKILMMSYDPPFELIVCHVRKMVRLLPLILYVTC